MNDKKIQKNDSIIIKCYCLTTSDKTSRIMNKMIPSWLERSWQNTFSLLFSRPVLHKSAFTKLLAKMSLWNLLAKKWRKRQAAHEAALLQHLQHPQYITLHDTYESPTSYITHFGTVSTSIISWTQSPAVWLIFLLTM